jgi:hypothetical protein
MLDILKDSSNENIKQREAGWSDMVFQSVSIQRDNI